MPLGLVAALIFMRTPFNNDMWRYKKFGNGMQMLHGIAGLPLPAIEPYWNGVKRQSQPAVT